MHESQVRVTGILVIGATPVEVDLGKYKHTRIAATSSGDGVYISNTSQVSTSNAFHFESGAANEGLPPLNLYGFGGIVWMVRDGSGAAYISIIQWGEN